MTVYVVIIEDRHIDVEVEVFTTPEAAIARAKAFAEEEASGPSDLEEIVLTPGMQRDGWLYAAEYSCERDSVRVVARKIVE